ncbi:MAG: amino acid adenylation domain-containing protein [Pseudonocardia sp.]
MLLQDYAARSAERRPDALAVALHGERLTYADLEQHSNRLAAMLVEQGCAPGDRVALLTQKSPRAAVAMLAALKARCPYVPVDVDSPAPRVAHIMRAAEPRILLATPDAASLLEGILAERALPPGTLVGSLTPEAVQGEGVETAFDERDAEALDAAPSVERAQPEEAAHILFTSGSTGIPKGVVITHRNVTTFVEWALRHFGTRETDRISGHPPLHFDLSTFDPYATYAAGAELHMVPASASLSPRGLAEFIRAGALTQWFSVPSVLTYLAKFDAVTQDDFPALERLLWCGKVLPTPVLAHWMRRLPHARFTNLYGPTEATIASSFFDVPGVPEDERRPVPIGTACDDEELLVLDEQLGPVPAGEIGELFIGGAGLSPGYWRDAERTGAVFVADPRPGRDGGRIYRTGDLARMDGDGVVHFLGRTDSQIKSRGYRIELGEIETVLETVEGLRECAVVGVDTGGFEGTAICCAYASVDGKQLEAPELRSALAEQLPTYMLPSRWIELDALPKNVNGKIDRPALRERFSET